MYLDWRKLESYNVPLKIVLGQRGMGKTFYPVFKHIKQFLDTGKRFVYLVDTDESVKMISSNHGEKFFSRILEYMEKNPTNSNKKYLSLMRQSEITTDDLANKIIGGTIIINNLTAGYILSIDNFHKTKRNNFTNISAIIVDEFVPEKVDIRVFKNPYKVNSIIQSIARTDNVLIYMLGNTVSIVDPIISRFKLSNLKMGEIRKIYVNNAYGEHLLGVAWKPDPKDYPELTKQQAQSVAGLFAQAIGETDLESNIYKDDLPKALRMPNKLRSSKCMFIIHGPENIKIRLNHVKSTNQYYCLPEYTGLTNHNICFDKKYIKPGVKHDVLFKDVLLKLFKNGYILFQSGEVYNHFKIIFGLET